MVSARFYHAWPVCASWPGTPWSSCWTWN